MGLRAFHVVFIAVSAALCLWLLGWGWAHRAERLGAALAGVGAAGFLALAAYLRAFLRRSRPSNGFSPKLAALLLPALAGVREASACTVCVGAADGDVASAFQRGIAFLAVLVLATLGGLAAMMLRAIRAQEAGLPDSPTEGRHSGASAPLVGPVPEVEG